MTRELILFLQGATFIGLGALFLAMGEYRLGISQLFLAVVQGLIYA